MEKRCDNCAHYRAPEDARIMGTCLYPIPEWLRVGITNAFVYESQGADCLVFVSTADAPKAALEIKGGSLQEKTSKGVESE